jgi:hypothetical protein
MAIRMGRSPSTLKLIAWSGPGSGKGEVCLCDENGPKDAQKDVEMSGNRRMISVSWSLGGGLWQYNQGAIPI